MVLRRLQNSRFSEVDPAWRGHAVAIFAGGSSLTLEQVGLVREARAVEGSRIGCIAVNDAYLWAPWVDILYAADASWHNAHKVGTPKPKLRLSAEDVRKRFESFAGQKCSIQSQIGNITDDATHILKNARTSPTGMGLHANGLSLQPGSLITGSNSGWQATNLAALAGSKFIMLFGMDAKAGKDGSTHWSGGHVGSVSGESDWLTYRKSFHDAQDDLKRAGIRVINCSPISAIEAFEKMSAAQALVTWFAELKQHDCV